MADVDAGGLRAAVTRAALDPGAWQGVVDALAAAFPGSKPGLVGHDVTQGRNWPGVQANYEDRFVDSYAAYYGARLEGLERWAALEVGRVVHSFEVIREEDLLRTEHYNDWLKPQGDIRHAAVTVLRRDPGRLFLFTQQVELRAAPCIMDAVMDNLRDLVPLMSHALDVNRMLLGLRLNAALLRQGVEPGDAGVVLLSARGGVLYANARAEAMLEKGDPLRADALGRLGWSEAAATERIDLALRGTARPMTAFRTGTQAGPCEVRVLPVTAEVLDGLGGVPLLQSVAPSLLVVLRRAAVTPDEAGLLARRLGLTRAEAEVALLLARGATVAEAAEARGVSIGTVRTQVKAAMAKTLSRRQSDLVRVVLTAVRPGLAPESP